MSWKDRCMVIRVSAPCVSVLRRFGWTVCPRLHVLWFWYLSEFTWNRIRYPEDVGSVPSETLQNSSAVQDTNKKLDHKTTPPPVTAWEFIIYQILKWSDRGLFGGTLTICSDVYEYSVFCSVVWHCTALCYCFASVIVLFIVLVLYCVSLYCTCCYPNWGFPCFFLSRKANTRVKVKVTL
jgi:hypothetical protein